MSSRAGQQGQSTASAEEGRWVLAIHGGAGVINSKNEEWLADAKRGLAASLTAGQSVLASGGSAIDAVVAAVMCMEDDPHFNAGVGSVLAASGHHELEASVMTSDGRCGAVALVKHVSNPIKLAQQVMKHTPHIFLSGAEVEAFAVQQGHTLVDNASFTTEQRRQQWQRQKDEDKLAPADEIVQQHVHNEVQQQQQQQEPRHGQADDGDRHCQTVGAVAIDSSGRLAAATSTGGRTNKWDGRIGDTPMIGAGTWADKQCALSGTGVGEEFIRRAAAHDVAARVKYKGCSLRQAMREVVWESFAEGDGGFVGVSADYTAVWDFNSGGMYRGSVDHTGKMVTAIFPEDDRQDDQGGGLKVDESTPVPLGWTAARR